MRFLCLAYEEERKLNELSQAEWHTLRQETLDYVETMRRSGRLILTLPLQSATTASTLRVREGKTMVTVGPFAETREQIGGFFLKVNTSAVLETVIVQLLDAVGLYPGTV